MTTVQIDLGAVPRRVVMTGPGQPLEFTYNPRGEDGYTATLELEPGTWTVSHTYTIDVEEESDE
jgi:hypothetical protein